MTDVQPGHIEVIDLTDWFQLDVETRALALGTAAVKAQAHPHKTTNRDYFLLGLGNRDPEAVALLQQDGVNRNLGLNFEEMFTLDAVFASFDARGGYRNTDTSPRGKGTAFESWRSGNSAHEHNFVDDVLIEKVGPVVVVSLAAASGVMSAGLVGIGAAWAVGSVGAMAAMAGTSLLGTMNPAASTAIMKMVQANGFSKVMQGLRRGGVWLFRLLQGVAAGSVPLHETADLYEAITNENVVDEVLQIQRMADLEKQGYSFEYAPQAAGEDELFAYEQTDEDLIMYDPEGNIVSSEDKEALLDGGDVPEAFRDEAVVADAATLGQPPLAAPNQVFGVADQYSNTGASSPIPEGDAATILANADKQDSGNKYADRVKVASQAIAGEQARYNEDPFLGVPQDYFRIDDTVEKAGGYGIPGYPVDKVTSNVIETPYAGLAGFPTKEEILRLNQERGGPIYSASSINSEVARWDQYDIIEFQQRALEGGLINPESSIDGVYYLPGSLDAHTMRALEHAMIQANVNGNKQTYEEALDGIILAREKYKDLFGDKDQPPPWTPSQAYFEIDPATAEQKTKAWMREELGRDPNQWEINIMADQMKVEHRANYDERMAGEKAVYEATGRAAEYDEPQALPDFQNVDEDARFAEQFEDRYSVELGQMERHEQVQESTTNLFSGLSQLSRLMGGV